MRKAFFLLFLMFALPLQGKELRLYNWSNYLGPQSITRFEKYCHCRLIYDTYGSNEELLAKLLAGATGYDILVPTGYAVSILRQQNLLMPLKKELLPNLGNIDPRFKGTVYDPENRFAVPYAFTTTIIGYNAKKIAELGLPTNTWALIFEPHYLEKIKGRVTVLDDARELFGAAMIYLGFTPNDTKEEHLRQAASLLKKAKPYWAAFNNESYQRLLASGDIWVAQGYSSDLFQVHEETKQSLQNPVALFLPKEGAVIATDFMVIYKDAPHPDLAHQFINFMLEGKNSAKLTNLIGAGNPNRAAIPYIQPELLQIEALFPRHAKLFALQEWGRDMRRRLDALWLEVKID